MKQFFGEFNIVSCEDEADFGTKALYLRHKSGMEVLHLKCDDKENLFAFVFRTPVMDDKGKPHIIEHSVLCGSKKYPLKEPFVNLMNQSVNSFLNAMTYPDMTMYPASTVNRKDYYNLMSVYGDAVFFPRLSEDAFMQEAHRLEENNGEYSIQGVVYNEMKGAYSSFTSVASDIQTASLMQGTCYAHDSGGDPLEVAKLSYGEFISFHKKYYKPSNCLLFLYGDIPTEETLDFVQHDILDRIDYEKDIKNDSDVPFVEEEMDRMMKASPLSSPITVNAIGPDSDTGGSAVTMNYRMLKKEHKIEDAVEAVFLAQLLSGNDTSPMSKALNASGYGDHLICGINNSVPGYTLSLGLGGVDESNIEKVRALIDKTLEGLQKEGFTSCQIEAVMLAIDFSYREKIRTSDGPFSLILLENAASAWVDGKNPAREMCRLKAYEEFKRKIKAASSESVFCVELMKRLLIDNKDKAFVTVTPSSSYMKEREEKEKEETKLLLEGVDKKELKKRLHALHEAQGRKETLEEVSCIPRLSIDDLSKTVDPITANVSMIEDIPLITSCTDTNGIVYFSMLFPVDTLPTEDLPYLSFLSDCVFYTGGGGMAWDKCLEALAVCTGGGFSTPLTNTLYNSEDALSYLESVKQYNFTGRDWFEIGFKFPIEKMDTALPLFSSIVPNLDFSNNDRLKTLLAQSYDAIRSSVIPYGSKMATMRSRCRLSRNNALEEIWNGLSQLFTMRKLASLPVEEAGERLKALMDKIISSGTIIHVTADDKSLQSVIERLPRMIRGENGSRRFLPLSPRPVIDNSALYRLTLLPNEREDMKNTAYTLKSQVGFAAMSFYTGEMDYIRSARDTALCRWMASNILWERIRTKGGSYGSSAWVSNRTGIATMSTYRDPAPYKSLEVMKDCMREVEKMQFSKEDIERLITGSYSDYVEPLSPSRYGAQGLVNTLYALTNEERNKSLKALLEITSETLHNEAVRILDAMEGGVVSAVICGAKKGSASANRFNEIDIGL